MAENREAGGVCTQMSCQKRNQGQGQGQRQRKDGKVKGLGLQGRE